VTCVAGAGVCAMATAKPAAAAKPSASGAKVKFRALMFSSLCPRKV
jgi:hypothetical protein